MGPGHRAFGFGTGKDGDDRYSYGFRSAPLIRGFWAETAVAQHRLMGALCGGTFRASRDLGAAAGFSLVLTLGLTVLGFAGSPELGAPGYLLAFLPCVGCGGMGLAARARWSTFVDVVEAAYPHRSVALGWPHEFLLGGSLCLFAAGGLALVAMCVACGTPKKAAWTSPGRSPAEVELASSSSSFEQRFSAAQHRGDMPYGDVSTMAQPYGTRSEWSKAAPPAQMPVAEVVAMPQQPVILTGTVIMPEGARL